MARIWDRFLAPERFGEVLTVYGAWFTRSAKTAARPRSLHRLTIIVTKRTGQSFSAHDGTVRGADLVSRIDQEIAEALVIALVVIELRKLVDRSA